MSRTFFFTRKSKFRRRRGARNAAICGGWHGARNGRFIAIRVNYAGNPRWVSTRRAGRLRSIAVIVEDLINGIRLTMAGITVSVSRSSCNIESWWKLFLGRRSQARETRTVSFLILLKIVRIAILCFGAFDRKIPRIQMPCSFQKMPLTVMFQTIRIMCMKHSTRIVSTAYGSVISRMTV